MKKQAAVHTAAAALLAVTCSAAALLANQATPASIGFEELSLHIEVDLPSSPSPWNAGAAHGSGLGKLLDLPAEIVLVGAARHGIARVRVRDAVGRAVLGVDCPSTALGVSELEIESAGRTLREVLGAYPPGEYAVEAMTIDGVHIEGTATLRGGFPGLFAVVSPLPGEIVDPAGEVTLAWTPSLAAARYVLEVEQEELRAEFQVSLAPDRTIFTLPAGWLEPGRTYEYSLTVEGDTDNELEIEGTFLTSPPTHGPRHSTVR